MPIPNQPMNFPYNSQQAAMPQGQSMGMGGSGIDTPQEKQAVQLFTKAIFMMLQAVKVDPSLAVLTPSIEKLGLDMSDHYGIGDVVRMQLDKAKEAQKMQRFQNISGPGVGVGGPPMAAPLMARR